MSLQGLVPTLRDLLPSWTDMSMPWIVFVGEREVSGLWFLHHYSEQINSARLQKIFITFTFCSSPLHVSIHSWQQREVFNTKWHLPDFTVFPRQFRAVSKCKEIPGMLRGVSQGRSLQENIRVHVLTGYPQDNGEN